MDEDADPQERPEGPRDQERLLRLARLPLAGLAASLAVRLARDSSGIRFAVTSGLEHVLSVSLALGTGRRPGRGAGRRPVRAPKRTLLFLTTCAPERTLLCPAQLLDPHVVAR